MGHPSGPASGLCGSRYRYSKLRYRLLFRLLDGVCNPVARLHRVSGRRPRWPEPRSILVVQLDHVGDAVLTTPMLAGLRQRFPQAAVDVLASPWNQEIFQTNPHVRQVHVSSRNWQSRDRANHGHVREALRLGRCLRRCCYDVGIDPRGDFLIALVLWLAGIPRRIGWDCGGGGFLLTDTPAWDPGRHEIRSRQALLHLLGADGGPMQPQLFPSWADRYAVRERLAALPHLHGPLVLLHLSAGMAAKRWPLSHASDLTGLLVRRCGAQVVLIGDRQDRRHAQWVTAIHPQAADWTGQLTLMELAALAEEADLFVGADSGPAHIAAAVGTNCLVLFSGTNQVGRWQPIGPQVHVLQWPVSCSPCRRKRCPVPGHPCMTGIRPSDVFELACRLLARRQSGLEAAAAAEPRRNAVAQPAPAMH